MRIPLSDLRPQHRHMVDDILEKVRATFDEGDFLNGQTVKDFEKAFAQYIGVRNAVSVKCGADALWMALRCIDIMPGDDVLVPAFGRIDVPATVARLYANPVFVDIDPNTYALDPTKLQESITDKSRAIVISHMFGQACGIEQIKQFADANNLEVIEDVSQALGAVYMNKKLGAHGALGCYSFDPTANLTGAGNGGMLVVDDDNVAERLRRLRDRGRTEGDVYEELGLESQLDSIQGIILKMKLEELDESNSDRIENARLYERLLVDAPVKRPRFLDDGSHVYNSFPVEHEQRDQIEAFLAEKGIGAKPFCPMPLHLQPCFEYLEYGQGNFPVAESISTRILTLPVYPGLKKREIEEVAAAVHEFFGVTA